MAGGSGTRMGMGIPKQLLEVGKKPMMIHLLNNAALLEKDVFLVLSNQNKQIIVQTLVDQKYFVFVNDMIHNDLSAVYDGMKFRFKNINVYISIQPVANGTGGAMMALERLLERLLETLLETLFMIIARSYV